MITAPTSPTRAVVVFCDRTEIWWLRPLRRGFRHCFALLDVNQGWLLLDPMSHHTRITLLPRHEATEIIQFYNNLHMTALEVPVSEPPRRTAPWRPYSCVEEIKRILGVHAGWILTPHQLFNFFSDYRKKDVAVRNKTGI